MKQFTDKMFAVLIAAVLALGAQAAPPALTVVPAAPKPGDTVTITGPVGVTFDVRGIAQILTHPNKKSIVFILPDTGTGVVVIAVAGAQAKPADVAVWASGTGSPGPGPGPGPLPVNDELKKLVADLNAAYKIEPAADKALMPKLIAIYATLPDAATKAKTWGELLTAMHAEAIKQEIVAAPDSGKANKLVFIRGVLNNALDKKLPTKMAGTLAIDEAGWEKAKAAFALVAEALAAVK